eukprot:snap_masked-scaffold_16-processed-gene-2.33-mRNA-1 protein AED:0.63 eAED:0.63 QI:0/-1/0/1/-1/1/1/0/1210
MKNEKEENVEEYINSTMRLARLAIKTVNQSWKGKKKRRGGNNVRKGRIRKTTRFPRIFSRVDVNKRVNPEVGEMALETIKDTGALNGLKKDTGQIPVLLANSRLKFVKDKVLTKASRSYSFRDLRLKYRDERIIAFAKLKEKQSLPALTGTLYTPKPTRSIVNEHIIVKILREKLKTQAQRCQNFVETEIVHKTSFSRDIDDLFHYYNETNRKTISNGVCITCNIVERKEAEKVYRTYLHDGVKIQEHSDSVQIDYPIYVQQKFRITPIQRALNSYTRIIHAFFIGHGADFASLAKEPEVKLKHFQQRFQFLNEVRGSNLSSFFVPGSIPVVQKHQFGYISRYAAFLNLPKAPEMRLWLKPTRNYTGKAFHEVKVKFFFPEPVMTDAVQVFEEPYQPKVRPDENLINEAFQMVLTHLCAIELVTVQEAKVKLVVEVPCRSLAYNPSFPGLWPPNENYEPCNFGISEDSMIPAHPIRWPHVYTVQLERKDLFASLEHDNKWRGLGWEILTSLPRRIYKPNELIYLIKLDGGVFNNIYPLECNSQSHLLVFQNSNLQKLRITSKEKLKREKRDESTPGPEMGSLELLLHEVSTSNDAIVFESKHKTDIYFFVSDLYKSDLLTFLEKLSDLLEEYLVKYEEPAITLNQVQQLIMEKLMESGKFFQKCNGKYEFLSVNEVSQMLVYPFLKNREKTCSAQKPDQVERTTELQKLECESTSAREKLEKYFAVRKISASLSNNIARICESKIFPLELKKAGVEFNLQLLEVTQLRTILVGLGFSTSPKEIVDLFCFYKREATFFPTTLFSYMQILCFYINSYTVYLKYVKLLHKAFEITQEILLADIADSKLLSFERYSVLDISVQPIQAFSIMRRKLPVLVYKEHKQTEYTLIKPNSLFLFEKGELEKYEFKLLKAICETSRSAALLASSVVLSTQTKTKKTLLGSAQKEAGLKWKMRYPKFKKLYENLIANCRKKNSIERRTQELRVGPTHEVIDLENRCAKLVPNFFENIYNPSVARLPIFQLSYATEYISPVSVSEVYGTSVCFSSSSGELKAELLTVNDFKHLILTNLIDPVTVNDELEEKSEDKRSDILDKLILHIQQGSIDKVKGCVTELETSFVHHERGETIGDILNYFVDPKGNTLLHIAAQQGNRVVCKFLLGKEMKLNVQNLKGNTVLHFCHMYGFSNLADYFVSKGAVDTIQNNLGQTCYEINES